MTMSAGHFADSSAGRGWQTETVAPRVIFPMAQLELFSADQTFTTRKGGQIGHRVGHGELFPEVAGASLLTVSRQEVATVAHAVTVAVAVAKAGEPATPTTPKARKAKRKRTDSGRINRKARKAEAKARQAKKRRAKAEAKKADQYGALPMHHIDGKATVAVEAYRRAYLAEVAGNRKECAEHFAKVVEVIAPAVRLSARLGGLVRRALGISNPNANLLKYSTGKSETEHFAQSRAERECGRGVWIAEHIRPTGGDVDAFAAADASFGRAFRLLVAGVAKGEELPNFRKAAEEEATDGQLAGFITGTASRIYREEVYGRTRSNSKNKKNRKPATLGSFDPIDYRQDIGAYQLDIDSRYLIISEFSHILSSLKQKEERDPVTGNRLDPMRVVYAFAACYGGARAGRPKAGEVVSKVKPHHILGVSRAQANRDLGKKGKHGKPVFDHMKKVDPDLNIIGRRLEMARLTYRFCTLLNTLHGIRERAK